MSLSNIPLFCSIDIQKFSTFIPVDTYYIPYFFYLLFMCSCLVYPWHICHWMQSVQQSINQFIFRFFVRSIYSCRVSFPELIRSWYHSFVCHIVLLSIVFVFFRLELFFSLPSWFFSSYVKVSPTVTSYHSSCYLKPTWRC